MPYFVDDKEKEEKAYSSLLVSDPKQLTVFGSDLAQKIIEILSKQPSSAMDVARKLKQHEQKIYYHFRNLERIGIIKLLKTEMRVGAQTKIYTVTHPVISLKLFDANSIVNKKTKIKELEFFDPFIKDGKLNATIIIGSPNPHGKYVAQSSDGCCAIDLALFLGSLIKESELPNYKLDTEISEDDLKNNFILVGGPKANIIVDKMNKSLPIYFDYHREWNIVSPFSKNIYTEDDVGVVAKIKNPFNGNKQVLVLAGKRFRGTRATILAVVNHLKEIEKGNKFDSNVMARVVQGIDRDADGRIDDVEFLE
jgi:DNA-binding PadR family transcriptional regulator